MRHRALTALVMAAVAGMALGSATIASAQEEIKPAEPQRTEGTEKPKYCYFSNTHYPNGSFELEGDTGEALYCSAASGGKCIEKNLKYVNEDNITVTINGYPYRVPGWIYQEVGPPGSRTWHFSSVPLGGAGFVTSWRVTDRWIFGSFANRCKHDGHGAEREAGSAHGGEGTY